MLLFSAQFWCNKFLLGKQTTNRPPPIGRPSKSGGSQRKNYSTTLCCTITTDSGGSSSKIGALFCIADDVCLAKECTHLVRNGQRLSGKFENSPCCHTTDHRPSDWRPALDSQFPLIFSITSGSHSMYSLPVDGWQSRDLRRHGYFRKQAASQVEASPGYLLPVAWSSEWLNRLKMWWENSFHHSANVCATGWWAIPW